MHVVKVHSHSYARGHRDLLVLLHYCILVYSPNQTLLVCKLCRVPCRALSSVSSLILSITIYISLLTQSPRFQVKGKTVLEIVFNEGSRVIAADSEAEADAWLAALNRVLEQQRTPVIPPSAEVVNLKRLQQTNQQQQQQQQSAQLQSPTPNGGLSCRRCTQPSPPTYIHYVFRLHFVSLCSAALLS